VCVVWDVPLPTVLRLLLPVTEIAGLLTVEDELDTGGCVLLTSGEEVIGVIMLLLLVHRTEDELELGIPVSIELALLVVLVIARLDEVVLEDSVGTAVELAPLLLADDGKVGDVAVFEETMADDVVLLLVLELVGLAEVELDDGQGAGFESVVLGMGLTVEILVIVTVVIPLPIVDPGFDVEMFVVTVVKVLCGGAVFVELDGVSAPQRRQIHSIRSMTVGLGRIVPLPSSTIPPNEA